MTRLSAPNMRKPYAFGYQLIHPRANVIDRKRWLTKTKVGEYKSATRPQKRRNAAKGVAKAVWSVSSIHRGDRDAAAERWAYDDPCLSFKPDAQIGCYSWIENVKDADTQYF